MKLKSVDKIQEITSRYVTLSLEDFGVQKFFDLLPYSSAQTEAQSGFQIVSHLNRPDLQLAEPSVVTP